MGNSPRSILDEPELVQGCRATSLGDRLGITAGRLAVKKTPKYLGACRLLPQPGGFEGFGSLLEHPKASDLPVLDRVHVRASRGHLDPLAPPEAGGARDHNLGACLNEALHLKVDLLERRVELIPEGLALATAAIDTLQR